MKRFKEFGKTLAHVCILFALLAGIGNFFVSRNVKAQSSWLNAAQLESLRLILNTFGVAVWPNHAADPVTCSSNVDGAYYFNTSTNAFRVCDGTSWADGGGGIANLDDLGDVTNSAPADNQILVFNSGSGDYENEAQGAAAVDDHNDVEAPTPSDGDILLYDGVTDNRWENTPGAAPTTLAGLSDTTLTAPALGDYLIRNGTDWKNVNTGASFMFYPHLTHTFTANQICATDNDLRVFRMTFTNSCTVDRVVWGLETDSTNCDEGSVGIYTLDGNTLLLDSGVATYSASNTIINQNPADVYIEAGDYFLAYTSSECSSACTITSSTPWTPTSSINVLEMYNTGNTMIGTPLNQSTVGVLPATLSTITANNDTTIQRPFIKFVCTDP